MWLFKPNIFLEHFRNSSGDYSCQHFSWILGFCNCKIWPLATCSCPVCLVGVLRQWWLLSTSCSGVCLIYCNWKDDPFGRRGNDKLLSKQTNRYPSNSVVVWAIKIKFCQDEPICPGMNWTFLLSFLVVFLNKDVNFFQPLSHDAFNLFRLKNLLPPHRTAQERVLPFSVPERKLEGSRSASCHYLTEWGIHVEDQSSCVSKEHSEEREAKTWSCKKGHLNSEW